MSVMSTPQRPIGRNHFKGSPITVWCESCADYVVTKDSGRCVWCDTPIDRDITREQRAADRRRRSDAIDRRIVLLRSKGMPYSGIVTALGVYDGVFLSLDTVRRRAHAMGVARDPRFARASSNLRPQAVA